MCSFQVAKCTVWPPIILNEPPYVIVTWYHHSTAHSHVYISYSTAQCTQSSRERIHLSRNKTQNYNFTRTAFIAWAPCFFTIVASRTGNVSWTNEQWICVSLVLIILWGSTIRLGDSNTLEIQQKRARRIMIAEKYICWTTLHFFSCPI